MTVDELLAWIARYDLWVYGLLMAYAMAKTGPLPVAEYSVLLMHGTSGRCYSAAEYGAILERVGMKPGTYQPTVADRGFLTASKPG